MRHLIYSAAAVAIGALVASSFAASPASAGVVGMGDQSTLRSGSLVEQVHYRHYWRGATANPMPIIMEPTRVIITAATIPSSRPRLALARRRSIPRDLAFLPFFGPRIGQLVRLSPATTGSSSGREGSGVAAFRSSEPARRLPGRALCGTSREIKAAGAIHGGGCDFSGGGGGGAVVFSVSLRFAAGSALSDLHSRRDAEDFSSESRAAARRDIFLAALFFVFGFGTAFTAPGATASFFGQALRANMEIRPTRPAPSLS